MRLRLLWGLVTVGVMLAIPAGTGAADTPPTRVVASQILVESFQASDGGCRTVAYLVFGDAPGAVQYDITYTDSGAQQATTAPPFQDDRATAGTHRLAIAGASYGPPCGSAEDEAYYRGRFAGPTVVKAVFPLGTHTISGHVLKRDGKPSSGVTLSISGASGVVTDAAGAYSAVVAAGSHVVSAGKGYCVKGKSGCVLSTTVSVPPDQVVDFSENQPKLKLAGQVMAQRCSRSGCSLRGRAGVTVQATSSSSGDTGRAKTGRDGSYSMRLPQGTYDVAPRGVRATPPTQRVTLVKAISGVNFRTCAAGSARTANAPPLLGYFCHHTITVTVRDQGGNRLAGVTIEAQRKASSLGSPEFYDVVQATTNSQGRATLELYEDTWRVYLSPENELASLQPPGILTVESKGYRYDMQRCDHGTIVHNNLGSSFGPHCDLTLALGKVPTQLGVDIRAHVVPVHVTLGAGLGFGYVQIRTQKPDNLGYNVFLALHSQSSAPLPQQVRFEAAVDFGPFYFLAGDLDRNIAADIQACSPGTVVFDNTHHALCRLALNVNTPRADVRFSFPGP